MIIEPQYKLTELQHPIQPVGYDTKGIERFKGNAIVKYLADANPEAFNNLTTMQFTREDHAQFAQLMGCTIEYFYSLPYVNLEKVEM